MPAATDISDYYICSAKQRAEYAMGMLRVEAVEKAVLESVRREQFTPATMQSIREEVARALDDFMESDREAKASLRAQQKTLDDQEAWLVDLAAEGQLPIAKIRQRLDLITLQKAAIAEKLTRTEMRIQVG